MSILTAVLLTVLAIVNVIIISVIACALRACKNKNSRMGGIIVLSVLVADMLAVIGGVAL